MPNPVLYNYIDTETKFLFVPWFGLAGMLLTFLFLPDTTGLDLKEQERRWAFIRAGHAEDYHGIAVHPKHLSLWERWRGVGKHYNPDLDYKQKIEEMRSEWEEDQVAKTNEVSKGEMQLGREALEEDSIWTDSVSTYYKTTAPSVLNEKTGYGGKDESPDRSS